tara:strand:+ start:1046 stop:1636 length:591 start_codon:yes stop_codon:yes gene_type:complete
MSAKEIFSLAAVILTLLAYFPYLRSIRKGTTRPHVFSWLIWSLSTFIIFFAQIKSGGGVAAWPVGLSGAITFYIAILAYRKKADIRILLIDYVFFGIALLAIPLWIFTANPMWAVILITLIDVCGFIPTIRKAYYFPEQESMNFYFVFFIRCIFVILALEAYSLTTILFPLTIGLSSLLMCFILLQRNSIHSTTPI